MCVPNELTNSRVTLKDGFGGCSHGYEFIKMQTINHDDTWHHILQQRIHRHYSHINVNPVERHSDLLLPHANSFEIHGQCGHIQFHNGVA